MKKVWFMLAMLVCVLASCSGGGEDDPITPTPKPEVIKSEITIDSSIITNGLSFTHEKGEQSISFSTNENWTLSVASTTSGATWCTASSTCGTKGTANVKFIVTENTDYDNRSVSVTIKSGTASKTFTISQKCTNALLVTTDKYEISQEGGTIDIEVKANIEYKMEISEEAKDWIAESSRRGLTPYKHTLNISINEEKEKRQGEIYFKSGDMVETVTIYQAGGAILLLSKSEYQVSDKRDTISVDIKSNIEYGVQMPDADWIVDETSSRGLSSHTLKYVIKANETYDSRSASIIFFDKNGSLKDTLNIFQSQKDAIIVSKNEYTLEAVSTILDFEVNTNVEFKVETSVDWIIQNSESRGLEAKPLSFTISENTADEDREGVIIISSGELKQEIKVLQKSRSVFSLSNTEFNITSDGSEFNVEVSTNGEYTITMPEVDWISENKTRATASYTHTFTVSANETYDARDSEIAFTFKGTGEIVKVKVVQAQKDAIIIAKNEYTIKAVSTILDFEVNTNVDFKVETSVDWIIQNSESRGLEAIPLSFTISENTADEEREGVIIISSGELKQEIKILQKSKSVFSLSNTEFNITSDGGEFNVEVTTNGEYTITMPEVDWISENKTRATASYTHTFTVSANETYDARETEIIFTYKETNEAIKVKLMQAQKSVILISQKTYDVKAEGETIEVMLSTNVDFNVAIPNVGWISQIDSRALKENNILIEIKENTNEIGRSAEIVFTSENSHINESITINQAGAVKAGYADGVVTISTAGTMIKLLGDGYLDIKSLKVIGPINGDDIYYLRKMLGAREFNDANWSKLTTLDLSEASIVEGGEWYYKGCYTTNNVVGKNMFSNCTKLNTLILPDNITAIGEYAFCGSEVLTSVKIPNNVKKISMAAFYGCSALTTINLPDNLSSISSSLFWGCYALNSITIGKGVTSISSDAFYDCKSLKSINISDSVLTIGINAFGGCNSLSSVTIGKGVTTIGYNAFSSCYSLTNIYCYANTPPELGDDVFSANVNKTLYVPVGSSLKYKSSDWGNYFRNIIEIE